MKRQSGSRPAVLSYPNNFARFPEEGARPARNQQETRGGVSSLGGPALDGDGQSQADPYAPPLPASPTPWSSAAFVSGDPQAPRSPLPLRNLSAGRGTEEARGRGRIEQGTRMGGEGGAWAREVRGLEARGSGGPGDGPCQCPFRASRIPQGLTPQRRGQHPPPTPPHESSHLFALNLPRPSRAFGEPSSFSLLPPAEPFIFLPAAARRPGPGIGRSGRRGWRCPGRTAALP